MRRLTVILIFLSTLCAVQAQWHVVMCDGRRHVPISDVASFYNLEQQASGGPRFELAGHGRRIEGRAGAQEILINGVKYVLCFPMVDRGGVTYVSAMDVTKIIEPVMRPGKIKTSTNVKTVVLDAGHGGHDSGATGPGGAEKQFALDVALRARALLVRAGYQVKMTRASDVFIPLEERVAFANRQANAIFISIHFNKSLFTAGTGIETYALAPRGVPSMDEANLSYSDFKENPGNARDGENIALAAAAHSALVKNLRVTDRGIKRARFVVIKNTRIPAILIEGGFVNNPYDARLIASGDYRQRIAASILEAVSNFSQSTGGPVRSTPPSLIVSASAPTTIPILPKTPAAIFADPVASGTPFPSLKPVNTQGAVPGPVRTSE